MKENVYQLIEQEKLIEPGDFVIAGVSGGADSVCLLLLLAEYRQRVAFSLEVVHAEHGIRGEESRADARFVEALCRDWQIVGHIYELDVPGYAAEHGMGLEEAARTLRYDTYRRAAAASGKPQVKVALAHHADDNAETMLFQMARGSGIRGLCGIRPRRLLADGIEVIRPLLTVTRSQVEDFLSDCGQVFCVDRTNQDTAYSRNRIRHRVLPELVEVNRQAVLHMSQSAGMLLEIADYLAGEVQKILPEVCIFSEGNCTMQSVLFDTYPAVLKKEVIHRVLSEMAGSRKDIGNIHVEEVIRLYTLQVGRSLSLPYEMRAERIYKGVLISRAGGQQQSGQQAVTEEYEITAAHLSVAESGAEAAIALPDGELLLRVFDFSGEMREIQKKKYTKWFDYDKIKNDLRFRKRACRDYLIIDEQGHKKKLKDYFVGEKIPKEKRDKVWLLALDAHVIWVVGYRISAGCKVGPKTKRILEVQVIGGSYCEDQED